MTLLKNPGFETDWGDGGTHDCIVLPDGGQPYERVVGNIFTPANWLTWFAEGGELAQPEVRDAWKDHDPRRVYEGRKATVFFTFYKKHDGGLLQQVKVDPGTKVRFSAWHHTWSNSNVEGSHTDDPSWSEGAGFSIVSWDAGMSPQEWPDGNFPYDTGNQQTDAKPNMTFWVGIDPTGGIDARSPSIVWSDGQHNYNGYVRKCAVEATAEGDTVTVFLRSKTLWAFKHNDSYLDFCNLVIVEPPLPTHTYERTYVLLPNNDPFDPAEQARISALNPGLTIGPSADDAGVTNDRLTKRTVIVYKPQTWGGQDALENFWETYYELPDVIEYREVPDPPPTGILQNQCDNRWRDYKFGFDKCNETVCRYGCLLTDLSMAQKWYGIDEKATPISVDQALGRDGYNDCYLAWGTNPDLFVEKLNLAISLTTDTSIVDAHLAAKGCAAAHVNDAEHFVLVVKKINGRYWMLDSFMYVEGWLDEHYNDVSSWRIIEHKEPEPPDTDAKTGLHLQSAVGDWRGFIVETGGPVKVLNMWTELLQAKRSGAKMPVYRHWVNEQPLVPSYMATFVNMFKADMENACNILAREGFEEPFFAVEGYNETYAAWQSSIREAVACDSAFIDELMKVGCPVVPAVFTAAVGNIQLPEEDPNGWAWPLVADLARKTESYGGYLAYHNYWPVVSGTSHLVTGWKWYAGRWQGFDDYLTSQGIYVKWFFGESGAVGSTQDTSGNIHMNAEAGWRNSLAYGGNWSAYENDILECEQRYKNWNITHGNRCLGSTLFTSGPWGWEWFQIRDAEIDRLIEIL